VRHGDGCESRPGIVLAGSTAASCGVGRSVAGRPSFSSWHVDNATAESHIADFVKVGRSVDNGRTFP